jgi:hypothetical protein
MFQCPLQLVVLENCPACRPVKPNLCLGNMSRSVWWVGHVAHVGTIRNSYKTLAGKNLKVRDKSVDIVVQGKMGKKIIFKKIVWACEMIWTGSECGPATGFCKHGNERLSHIKCLKYIYWKYDIVSERVYSKSLRNKIDRTNRERVFMNMYHSTTQVSVQYEFQNRRHICCRQNLHRSIEAWGLVSTLSEKSKQEFYRTDRTKGGVNTLIPRNENY